MERIEGLVQEHRDLHNHGLRAKWAFADPKPLTAEWQALEAALQESSGGATPRQTPDRDTLLRDLLALGAAIGRTPVS